MDTEPIIHFEIQAPTLADIRAFADEVRPDLGCRAIARQTEEGYVIDAYLPEPQLRAAQGMRTASRVTLRVIENATEVGRERQKEVEQGNRFRDFRTVSQQVPRGLGRKE